MHPITHVKMVNYKCQFCSQCLNSVKQYLSHYKLHSNVKNIVFPCCLVGCSRQFVRFSSLKCHITRDHGHMSKAAWYSQDKQINDGFVCCLDSCGQRLGSLKSLISHTKLHISSDQPMPCPYLHCKGLFTKHTSYTSHISRKHRLLGYGFKESFILKPVSDEVEITTENVEDVLSTGKSSDFESEDNYDQNLSEVLLNSLALYYMKLEAVHLIPVSTINSLMSDITDLHNISVDIMFKNLGTEVQFDKSMGSKISQVKHSDSFKTFLSGDNAKFDTNYKRKNLFKKNYKYVEPLELYLGLDSSNKKCIYHYVPLKKSLKCLLDDHSVRRQLNKPLSSEKHVYRDITDGKCYLGNQYFQANKDALKLILYQDAFEIVNPLGAAKKTFKLIGIYFTLVDIYPENRSKIDPLQLTILCREKDFNYFDNGRVVLERLIQEIRELSVGLTIDGVFIKANLVCILGDNLGSHFIGGFSTNFSNEEFYCRYCLMTKSAYERNPLDIQNSELRTNDNFETSVKHIEINNLDKHQGIKYDCLFNNLDGFHCCSPALPPCLGHDLLEGVIRYDLALFLNHLINTKKWFDLKTLNFCIARFEYEGKDLDNKPVPVKVKCDNIGGHAVQTWTLLRLLPVVILKHVKDPEDEIWKAILLLRLITEFLCSPALSVNQVGILQQHIDDYILMRQRLFPSVKLRPKHHYVHHYPYLITQFGPLLRVWTMRFESKHTYFKRCIRSTKNFKNVTKSLSEKHQLLQCYYSVGNLFQSDIFGIGDANISISEIVGSEIFQIIPNFLRDNAKATYYRSISIHGYIVKTDNCIVIDIMNGSIGFGKVQLFMIVDNCVKIICKKYTCTRCQRGLYCLELEKGEDVFLDSSEVLDFYPLTSYRGFIALKHYPIEKWI